jgi:hypothetical protein
MREQRSKKPCECRSACARPPDGQEQEPSCVSWSARSSDRERSEWPEHREQTSRPIRDILSQTVSDTLRYEPDTLNLPCVDPDLTKMPAIERSGEVFRYQALRLEHGLFPGGTFREWLKVVARTAIVLAAPTLLLVPLITFLLSDLSKWTVFIRRSAVNLLLAFPALLLLCLLVRLLLRFVIRRR